jgi:hypothetical protein
MSENNFMDFVHEISLEIFATEQREISILDFYPEEISDEDNFMDQSQN